LRFRSPGSWSLWALARRRARDEAAFRRVIATVVLAAGGARRFGSQKLIAEANGIPLVRLSVERVIAGTTNGVIVVLGHEADSVRAALDGLPVRFVHNARPEDGLSGSLRAGIAALSPDTEAVIVALGDQPVMQRSVLPGLIARFHRGDAAIVAARYAGVQGTPVLFSRTVFDELSALSGDQGARAVVARDPGRTVFVDFTWAMPRDVDTPADLEALRRDLPLADGDRLKQS
jgi:molybdenum cofactor cytidylyltransferase